jgi:hypothetical protein
MNSSHEGRVMWMVALAVLVPGSAASQPRRDPVDARLQVELETPFTRISGMAVLPNGRLLVTDSGERRIVRLDAATGRATDVGGHGQGPREFLRPFAPMVLPDGSTWIYDVGNRRFLELDDEGLPSGVHPWPTSADYSGHSPPVAVDVRGRLYWEAWPSSEGKAPIYAWILRWTAGQNGDLQRQARIRVRDEEGRLILRELLARDGWSATSSGAIGILRATGPRVEWISPSGTTVVGPELELERFPIDDREIAALDRETSSGSSQMKGAADAQRPGRRAPTQWYTPEHLPPFYYDRVFAVEPTGLWAQRRLPADSPVSLIWRFDAEGHPLRRIRVRSPVQLLHVEHGGAFWAVHTDDLGIQRLRRYEVDP